MEKKRKKTFHLLEANFTMPNSQQYNLKTLLTDIVHEHNDLKGKELRIDDKFYQINQITSKNNILFFQFSKYTPGENATAIKTANKKKTEDTKLKEAAPPQDFDFSEGDIIVGIEDNNIFVCANNLFPNCIDNFFCNIITQYHSLGDQLSFNIMKPSRGDKIKIIQEHGIKSIILNNLMSSQENLLPSKNIFRRIYNLAFKKDPNLQNFSINSNCYMKLEIGSIKGKKNEELIKEAIILIEESQKGYGDAFVIITGNGQKITQKEINYTQEHNLPIYGNSVQFEAAIAKLKDFRDYIYDERENI